MPELNNRPLTYFCGNCLALAFLKKIVRPFKEVYPPDGKSVPFSISAQCPICGDKSKGINDEFFFHPELEKIVIDSSTQVKNHLEMQRRIANDSLNKTLEG